MPPMMRLEHSRNYMTTGGVRMLHRSWRPPHPRSVPSEADHFQLTTVFRRMSVGCYVSNIHL